MFPLFTGQTPQAGAARKSLLFASVGALLVVLWSLTVPNRYTSEARVLSLAKPSVAGSQLGALQSLAGLGRSSDALDNALPDIVKSRTLLGEALDATYHFTTRSWRFGAAQERTQTLADFFGAPDRDIAIQRLEGCLEVARDFRSGILTIRVTLPSAELASQVNQRLLEGLDRFLKQKRQERGRMVAEYMGERLMGDRKALEDSTRAFLEFADRNRGYLQSSDPAIRAAGERLEMDVNYRKQSMLRLEQEVDQAVLEEKDSTPAITILDPASLPTQKSGPSRLKWVLMAFIAAGLASLLFDFRHRLWSSPEGARL